MDFMTLAIEENEEKPKSKSKHNIKKEPDEKPKNVLYCKIACMAKRSRLKPSLKRVRVRQGSNVYPLEFNEYKKASYNKRLICPNCMGKMEITVRSEKAGSLYYKLTLLFFGLILILVNSQLLEKSDESSFWNTVIQTNAIILGILIIIIVLVFLNNYLKTRSKRSIRLKIKAQSSMGHKLYKSRRVKYTKKLVKN